MVKGAELDIVVCVSVANKETGANFLISVDMPSRCCGGVQCVFSVVQLLCLSVWCSLCLVCEVLGQCTVNVPVLCVK
jgi:hypothetical protein